MPAAHSSLIPLVPLQASRNGNDAIIDMSACNPHGASHSALGPVDVPELGTALSLNSALRCAVSARLSMRGKAQFEEDQPELK